MRYSRLSIRTSIVRLYGCLLQLYPPRFRTEFTGEIRDIFLDLMLEGEERGGFWLLKTSLRELTALAISILRECWHELRSRKEKAMALEDNNPGTAGLHSGGGQHLQTAGAPNWRWVARWTLLTTAAIPAALIAMAPLAALLIWFIDLGGKAGLWPSANGNILKLIGFVAAFSLMIAAIQWNLLHNFLPRSRWWFVATGGGLLFGSLVAAVGVERISVLSGDSGWSRTAVLLTVGLALGLAQWLYLRRLLPNAAWIIPIDGLAAGSVLLAGRSFTSLFELVGILILPGMITGVGLWLLLKQSQPRPARQEPMEAIKGKGRWLPRLARVGLGLAVLVPLFFVCIWVYAASQLALAKNEGIYSTPEEAVIGTNSQDRGGAQVARIENVRARPNRRNAQPHVWFGGAAVYLDRVPQGGNRDHYSAGSFYIQVRDGWVHVPEGAFPEFIGWVMELYGLEGVQR